MKLELDKNDEFQITQEASRILFNHMRAEFEQMFKENFKLLVLQEYKDLKLHSKKLF